VKLEPLRPNDLDAALALSTAEAWNQCAADWRRLLTLEPAGCFAAREGSRLVGTVTTLTYGRALAWIGMMVVDPGFRRRGIGVALMRMALDHLRGVGVTSVKLDATPAGRPLYESLGFAPETEIERWQGAARSATSADPRPANRSSPDALLALDQAAYGLDRSRLLERLVAEGVGEPLVAQPEQAAPTASRSRGRVASPPTSDRWWQERRRQPGDSSTACSRGSPARKCVSTSAGAVFWNPTRSPRAASRSAAVSCACAAALRTTRGRRGRSARALGPSSGSLHLSLLDEQARFS